MDSRLSRWCVGFIEAGWLAALVAIPLFYNARASAIFEPAKAALLRSIAVFMALAWLTQFIDRRGWRELDGLRRQGWRALGRVPLLLPILLLVSVYLVATAFSLAPWVSWSGSYQRLQGTYTTLAYMVIFGLMATTIQARAQVQRVVTAVIITSLPVAMYGVMQHFGLDPLPWTVDPQRRVSGHFGNPILFAAYLVLVIPLTVARGVGAFTGPRGRRRLTARVFPALAYVIVLVLQLLALYWSGSRGPWLGLAIGLFAFVLILLVTLQRTGAGPSRPSPLEALKSAGVMAAAVWLPLFLAGAVWAWAGAMTSLVFFGAVGCVSALAVLLVEAARGRWHRAWLHWISLAAAAGALLVVFNLPLPATRPFRDVPVVGTALATLDAWRELPGFGRLGRLLEDDRETGRVRVLIWTGVLELLGPHPPLVPPGGGPDAFASLRPLIGYGPETMALAYPRFYQPELALLENRGALPDRAHNETFDALVTTGAIGWLAWQVLFVSVFYYALHWLGLARTRPDRNVLVGLWAGGAAAAGLVLAVWRGAVYLGVAIPLGNMLGLALYLVYFALTGRRADNGKAMQPAWEDGWLLMGLAGALAAHYVEIGFGIAITATRLYCFAYMALLLVIGHRLPRQPEAALEEAIPSHRRQRSTRMPVARPGAWRGGLAFASLLALAVGTLSYDFMEYQPPPGQVIRQVEDVPTAGEIFHQSLFVHAGQGYIDSPFMFLILLATWGLGGIIGLGEAAGQAGRDLLPESGPWSANRSKGVAGLMALLPIAGAALLRLNNSAVEVQAAGEWLGLAVLWGWMFACSLAAILAFLRAPAARRTAGLVGAVGVLGSIPLAAGGGFATLYGGGVGLVCAVVLLLVWDTRWKGTLGLVLAGGSAAIAAGLWHGYLQAVLVQATILGVPSPPGASEVQRRVLEASQQMSPLALYLLFLAAVLASLSLLLARPANRDGRRSGTATDAAGFVLWLAASFLVVYASNLRVALADIVYNWGSQFEQRAALTGTVADWNYPIAIYERATTMAPREDFHWLGLGRATLEKALVTDEPIGQTGLLEYAQASFERAQHISPFNPDHTANLARLFAQWSALGSAEDRPPRLDQALAYYQAALALSPRQAVIWNELAWLTYTQQGDCDGAMALYERSAQVDPDYSNTYFDRADLLLNCADEDASALGAELRASVRASLDEGLAHAPTKAYSWLRAGQLYERLQDHAAALAAYQEASRQEDVQALLWQVQFSLARVHWDLGELEAARQQATAALAIAPPVSASEIQAFLEELPASAPSP